MKYHIFTAEYWLDQPDAVLRMYPCLQYFGFEIEEKLVPKTSRIRDERGRWCSQINYEMKKYGYVTIDTLEKLMELQKAVDHSLIIRDGDDDYGQAIMIYDDYIE